MERHFHTGDIAVIGIINLNWNCADRRVRIAELSQKQSRLIIEEQFDTRLARGHPLDDRDVFVLDIGNGEA